MEAKLNVIPGSHPCGAVEAASAVERIAPLRVELLRHGFLRQE